MPLDSLSIDRFRNLEPVNLDFSPKINLVIGANAAGKTSFLESLYVLARARSFRTRNLDKAVRTGAAGFQLVARVSHGTRSEIPVGISRSQRKLIARIDGTPARRLSDLAALFPVQWLGENLQRLVDDGPAYRRQYLDWGLFHVKPAYVQVWKRYQKLLKQRNAALRAGAGPKEVQAWNPELATIGQELHDYRQRYVDGLESMVKDVGSQLLPLIEDIQIHYRKGWATELSLAETLNAGLAKERELGYTQSGPHRADLVFRYKDQSAKEQLSRGQQKLLVIALQVAQAQLLREEAGQASLFLIDDLGAELDKPNQERVIELLRSIEAQVFITLVEEPEEKHWEIATAKRFHVKHGVVSEVV